MKACYSVQMLFRAYLTVTWKNDQRGPRDESRTIGFWGVKNEGLEGTMTSSAKFTLHFSPGGRSQNESATAHPIYLQYVCPKKKEVKTLMWMTN